MGYVLSDYLVSKGYDRLAQGGKRGDGRAGALILVNRRQFRHPDGALHACVWSLRIWENPFGESQGVLHGSPSQLRALLGEAQVEQGAVISPRSEPTATPLYGNSIHRVWTVESWLDDSVAYAPQQSYIQHGTIRDNILFGQPMWQSRYKEALRQASLRSDLELWLDGDHTEVGRNGVNLVSHRPVYSLTIRVGAKRLESTLLDASTPEQRQCIWTISSLRSTCTLPNSSTRNASKAVYYAIVPSFSSPTTLVSVSQGLISSCPSRTDGSIKHVPQTKPR